MLKEQSCNICLSLQAKQRCTEQQLSAYITDIFPHSVHFSAMVDISCLPNLV